MPLTVVLMLVYGILAIRYFSSGDGSVLFLDFLGTIMMILGVCPDVPNRWFMRCTIFVLSVVAFIIVLSFVEMDYLDNDIQCRWALIAFLCIPNFIYTQLIVLSVVKKGIARIGDVKKSAVSKPPKLI